MYISPLLSSFKEYFIRNPKFVWVSYISLVNMAVDAGAAPRNAYNSAAKLIRDTMQYDVTVLPEYKEAMQALDDSNIRQGVIFVFGSNLAGSGLIDGIRNCNLKFVIIMRKDNAFIVRWTNIQLSTIWEG